MFRFRHFILMVLFGVSSLSAWAARTPYDVLGVSRNATADEIKSAYRRLARRYHPDVNKDPQSEGRFKEAGAAFEVLGNADTRAAFDQFGTVPDSIPYFQDLAFNDAVPSSPAPPKKRPPARNRKNSQGIFFTPYEAMSWSVRYEHYIQQQAAELFRTVEFFQHADQIHLLAQSMEAMYPRADQMPPFEESVVRALVWYDVIRAVVAGIARNPTDSFVDQFVEGVSDHLSYPKGSSFLSVRRGYLLRSLLNDEIPSMLETDMMARPSLWQSVASPMANGFQQTAILGAPTQQLVDLVKTLMDWKNRPLQMQQASLSIGFHRSCAKLFS